MNEILPLSKVKEAIENFQNVKLLKYEDFETTEEYIKYFEGIFYTHFPAYHHMLQIQKPENFKFNLFRVREFSTIQNSQLFCEYSYPPPHFVSNGRCNFKNKPVFYCSNDPLTSLLEVVKESDFKEKKFCISTWSLIDNGCDFILDNFLQSDLHSLNVFRNLADNYNNNIDNAFEHKLTNDQKLGVIEFYKFIDSKFIEDQDYSISAFWSHKRLYAEHNYRSDIIIYPSVQTDRKSINMAIHPNFVDNNMKLDRLYVVELNDYDATTNHFNLSIVKYGKIEKNVIIWKNIRKGDQDYESNFIKDFGGMVTDLDKFTYTKID